ncbi:MAG: hypothetical protein ABI954_05675 [Pyrinomonadaceae bacterium]
MKIIFGLLLGALMCVGIYGQAEQAAEIRVEDISLARDNGSGKPGEVVDNFVITDVPLHCLIQLSSTAAVTVKMNLVAVKADGHKAGTNVVVISYTTTGSQDRVSFNASPDGLWSAGKYRIDVLLSGKLAKSLEFEINKATQETNKENKSPTRPIPRQSKKTRLARKN